MKTYCPVGGEHGDVGSDVLWGEGDEVGDDVESPVAEGGPYRGGVPDVDVEQLDSRGDSA